MKRFQFRLERVLEWRRSRMEEERCTLERLLGERARVRAQQARLDAALGAARRTVAEAAAAGQTLEGETLLALENFSRAVRHEKDRLGEMERELERRIAAQRERLLTARRDVRLLDRLRGRAHAAWERELDRELEALASELYLARWPAGDG